MLQLHNRKGIIAVIGTICLIVLVKIINSHVSSSPDEVPLHEQIQHALESKKTKAVIVTSSGVCCPSNRAYFQSFNAAIKDIIITLPNIVTLWIYADLVNEHDSPTLKQFLQQQQIQAIPSILIISSDGENVWRHTGAIEQEKLQKEIARSLQQWR